MASALAERGHHVSVIGIGDRGASEDAAFPGGVEWETPGLSERRGATLALRERLTELVPAADIVHIQGIYSLPGSLAAASADRFAKPYVVHLHGAVTDYHYSRKRWKKSPYENLVLRRQLNRATAVIAMTDSERRQARANLGLENVAVVAPIIAAPMRGDALDGSEIRAASPSMVGRTLVTFMGRITEKKDVPLLMDAFALLPPSLDAHLLIAGPADSAGRIRGLQRRARALRITDRVSFLGMVRGRAKEWLLASSNAFVLPSRDESFGLAVAEAMAHGTPVVISPEVGLVEYLNGDGLGYIADRSPGETARAIEAAVREPSSQRARRQRFTLETFSPGAFAERTERLYQEAIRSRR